MAHKCTVYCGIKKQRNEQCDYVTVNYSVTLELCAKTTYPNTKLCMDHRNKIKVPDPVVKDLTSKK